MPELPEVETIVHELGKVLPGKKIVKVEVLREKSFAGNERELVGRMIDGVERKSKMTVISFRHFPKKLVIHLKMTGQLIYLSGTHRVVGGHPTPDWVAELPSNSTRVIVSFSDGGRLFFNDLRVFGWFRLMNSDDFEKLIKRLPPDVTEKQFTLEYFRKMLGKSGRVAKSILMDQEKLGGVGNIYANEALYLARINPGRKAKELSEKEVEKLYQAVRKVIASGIKYGGASVDKYVDAAGLGGEYQEHFLVYRQEGMKCKRDGGLIKKSNIGGRGTYYCLGCQR